MWLILDVSCVMCMCLRYPYIFHMMVIVRKRLPKIDRSQSVFHSPILLFSNYNKYILRYWYSFLYPFHCLMVTIKRRSISYQFSSINLLAIGMSVSKTEMSGMAISQWVDKMIDNHPVVWPLRFFPFMLGYA